MVIKKFMCDELAVKIYDSRKAMGQAAADDAAECLKKFLASKDEVNAIFAAAPSQNEFLAALCEEEEIDWKRVNAFHMDEYLGLESSAPQGFGNFLRRSIFDKVPFRSVHYIDGQAAPADACAEYASLLKRYPVDVVFMGIGENGHIAFNDPHVALFSDPQPVKVVDLDDKCRNQQVHDGCFSSLDMVPSNAITLTIPTLMAASRLFCVVPAPTKAIAVKAMLTGSITERCPASILRRHKGAILYLDPDSSSLI
jgi:glucosamine-6-phosphate deaminase